MSGTVWAISVEGIMGNYFQVGTLVPEMLFKDKVYGRSTPDED